MSWYILPLLLSGLPRHQRAQVTEQLLPLALPGPPGTQLAFAAVTAERQVRKQAQTEQKLVQEAIQAGDIKSAEELSAFPALHSAFNRLPAAVQSGIFTTSVTPPVADREVTIAPNPDATAPAAARGGRSATQPTPRPT